MRYVVADYDRLKSIIDSNKPAFEQDLPQVDAILGMV